MIRKVIIFFILQIYIISIHSDEVEIKYSEQIKKRLVITDELFGKEGLSVLKKLRETNDAKLNYGVAYDLLKRLHQVEEETYKHIESLTGVENFYKNKIIDYRQSFGEKIKKSFSLLKIKRTNEKLKKLSPKEIQKFIYSGNITNQEMSCLFGLYKNDGPIVNSLVELDSITNYHLKMIYHDDETSLEIKDKVRKKIEQGYFKKYVYQYDIVW